jgi:hypothetical protein
MRISSHQKGAYARRQLELLAEFIANHEGDVTTDGRFWARVTNLINWGLSVKAIEYAHVRCFDNVVWFDVPTANLWTFYREICKEIEGVPVTFSKISRKTFTTRLLRNGCYKQKSVRYKGKVKRGVVWGVDQINFNFYQ